MRDYRPTAAESRAFFRVLELYGGGMDAAAIEVAWASALNGRKRAFSIYMDIVRSLA